MSMQQLRIELGAEEFPVKALPRPAQASLDGGRGGRANGGVACAAGSLGIGWIGSGTSAAVSVVVVGGGLASACRGIQVAASSSPVTVSPCAAWKPDTARRWLLPTSPSIWPGEKLARSSSTCACSGERAALSGPAR